MVILRNSQYRWLGVALVVGLMMLSSAPSTYGQGSIYGSVTNSDETIPANGEISFFGYLDETDEEIRIESCIGAGYDNGNWFDDFQNYLTESPGNPYDFHFYNNSNGEGFILSGSIPNNSFQEENIGLAAVEWPSQPSGLSGESSSISSIDIAWDYVADLTYHVYRREATSAGSFFRIDDPIGSPDNPGVSGNTYSDNNVITGQGYHYLIIAQDASGNLSPHSAFIEVISQEPETPVIACPDNITVECSESTEPENTGYATATDNTDPAPVIEYSDIITSGNCPQERVVTRTWTATDFEDNSAQCIQVITVQDNVAPELTCPENIAISFGASEEPDNTGAADVTDNCDMNPSVVYTDEREGNIITRTWTATDACGNGAQCEQTIEIIMHSGPVWHVSTDGSDENDGSPDYPFATIQKAIDITIPGDTVLLADGTYSGDGNRDLNLGGKAIVIMSENGPEATIIDCQGSKSEPHRGFNFHSYEDETTVVEGLTLLNGYAKTEGAGILCVNSSPSISNCILSENITERGGAGIACLSSAPEIIGCKFINNSAGHFGGGIYCAGASPRIDNCDFDGNSADEYGGAIFCANSSPSIDSCNFSDNFAENLGGAVCLQYSDPEIAECTFYMNRSNKTGGAIYCDQSSPPINESIFVRNTAADYGGAVACEYYSSPLLSNCSIIENGANKGGGIYCFFSSPQLEACIISFGIQGKAFHCRDDESNPILSCCDIFANTGGDWVGSIENLNGIDGNISADPLFCDPINGDYKLAGNSLCLAENNECDRLIGALGLGCDIPTDFAENSDETLPETFRLLQNYPNPFNPFTVIGYAVPTRCHVTMTIHNILGREVKLLLDRTIEAGNHEIFWDGKNNQGREVSSGIYFYTLRSGDYLSRKKMLLLK